MDVISTAIEQVASTLGELARMSPSIEVTQSSNLTVANVRAALLEFHECVRYLNTRRSKAAVIDIDSEADVQDVLYLLLRPWIVDLRPESPQERAGNRYVVKDFFSPSLRMVVEAKYVRDKDHGRNISKELHDDIETYRSNPLCNDLIFFVYDPDAMIPDKRALQDHIEIQRQYGTAGERVLRCYLIIMP